jgi:hypothetical protein
MDGGETWTNINNNIILAMAVRNNEIYAAGLTGPLYHSSDSGATWADIKANIPSRVVNSINFTSKHVLVGSVSSGLWLRPIGEVAPPYFYFPSTPSDSTFLKDEPIVIRVDQPMKTLDGAPVAQHDLEDLIHITTLAGTPANFTATLADDFLTITITISDVQENTAYRITIAPVANEQGIETTARSFVLRAITDIPPVVADISTEMSQNTTFNFTKELFMAKYTDPEGSPLAKVRVTALPSHGTLRTGGNVIAVNAEISAEQLSTLTYTPVSDFVGTDLWRYAASDGTSYSNSARVTVTISPVTSVSEWRKNLSFYPNPVDKALLIEVADGKPIDELIVMDMSGRSMPLVQDGNEGIVTVDFTGVPAGMYVLRIRSGKQLYFERIVRR